jgi:hypothetical protein
MNLRIDAVGKPYQGEIPTSDATQYNYRGGQHEMLIFMSRPLSTELEAIQRGTWQFGLLVRPEVLFLLYKPGSMPWSDAPYSWWQVKRRLPEEAVEPFDLPTEHSRALLTVIVVDAATGLVAAIKGVTFSPGFTQALHDAIRAQMAHEVSAAAYDQAVTRYYSIYTATEQMLPQLAARCTGGEE